MDFVPCYTFVHVRYEGTTELDQYVNIESEFPGVIEDEDEKEIEMEKADELMKKASNVEKMNMAGKVNEEVCRKHDASRIFLFLIFFSLFRGMSWTLI